MMPHSQIETDAASDGPFADTNALIGHCILRVLQLRAAESLDENSFSRSDDMNSDESVIRVGGAGSRKFEQALAEYVRQIASRKDDPEALARFLDAAGDQLAASGASLLPLTVAKSPRLAIRGRGKIFVLEPREVILVEGRGNYVVLRTAVRSHLVRESVSAIEVRLKPFGFVRIHRSTIVNEALVEEIRVATSGQMSLRLKGIDKEYGISKKYKDAVRLLASCWI